MLERLGDVLYWVACGLALVAFAVGCLIAISFPAMWDRLMFTAVAAGAAGVLWLVGRACQYVLAGR